MKRVLKMLLLVFFLIIIYVYTLLIESIPNELVIFEGENISMKTLLGITIKDINNQIEEQIANGTNYYFDNYCNLVLNSIDLNSFYLDNKYVNIFPRLCILIL